MSDQGAAGDDATEPEVEYKDDPKDRDNRVLVLVEIPKLKKKFMGGPANAEIDLKPTEWSFTLTVKVANKKLYRYAVEKLPYEISTDPAKTKYKVTKDEEVRVILQKTTPRSWSRELSSVGLEHAE